MDLKTLYVHRQTWKGTRQVYTYYKQKDIFSCYCIRCIGYIQNNKYSNSPGGAWGYKTKRAILKYVRLPTKKEKLILMLGAL